MLASTGSCRAHPLGSLSELLGGFHASLQPGWIRHSGGTRQLQQMRMPLRRVEVGGQALKISEGPCSRANRLKTWEAAEPDQSPPDDARRYYSDGRHRCCSAGSYTLERRYGRSRWGRGVWQLSARGKSSRVADILCQQPWVIRHHATTTTIVLSTLVGTTDDQVTPLPVVVALTVLRYMREMGVRTWKERSQGHPRGSRGGGTLSRCDLSLHACMSLLRVHYMGLHCYV